LSRGKRQTPPAAPVASNEPSEAYIPTAIQIIEPERETFGGFGNKPETRAAVVAAARRLFARLGYDGASVRAITRDAHANLGAVTYHFGSKHALYDAVLDQALSPLAARVAAAVQVPGTALDRAQATVLAYFEHLGENPDVPHLMMQTMIAGQAPPASVVRALGPVVAAITDTIREGQERGEIRAGDPLLFAFSVISQPVHLTLAQPMAKHIVGLDSSDPSTRARVVAHAITFVRAGLAVREEVS
jgi:AcrR family transcriptional regulator